MKLFKNLFNKPISWDEIKASKKAFPEPKITIVKETFDDNEVRTAWINIGGQLMKTTTLKQLKDDIVSEKVCSWNDVHDIYREEGKKYHNQLLEHAYCSLLEILNITTKQFTGELFKKL